MELMIDPQNKSDTFPKSPRGAFGNKIEAWRSEECQRWSKREKGTPGEQFFERTWCSAMSMHARRT